MRRSFALFALALVMLALAACGGGASSSTPPPPQGGGNTPPPPAKPSPDYIYVANRDAHTISAFKVEDSGISVVPGSPFTAGTSPSELFRVGDLLFASSATGVITSYRISPDNGQISRLVVGGTGYQLTSDGTNLYAANWGRIRAYRIDFSNGSFTELSGSPFGMYPGDTQRLEIAPDKTALYVVAAEYLGGGSSYEFQRIPRFSNGTLSATPTRSTTKYSAIFDFGTMPNGNLLASYQNGGEYVGVITPSLESARGTPAAVDPSRSYAVTAHPNGRFVFAALGNNTVVPYAVGTDGGLVPVQEPQPVGQGAFEIGISTSGKYLIVLNYHSSTVSIFKIDDTTGTLTALPGSPFPATSPWAMAAYRK